MRPHHIHPLPSPAINCRGQLLSLATPVVMGIINITADSFFEGSRMHVLHEVVAKAGQHLAEGAAILDLGAQSTRPGATIVGPEEEISRLLPAIHAILHHYPQAIISIDTWYADVAEKAIHAGAAIINDISAGDLDPAMIPTAGRLQVPYIAMHMQGKPATMQSNPQYEDVVQEVLDYLVKKLAACREAGVKDFIADPGFGFGKTLEHNYALMKDLHLFYDILGVPVLTGISRKSMLYKLLHITPEEALNGTTVLNTIALQQGTHILRVHDVKAAMEAIRITEKVKGN
ncbi:dihydropteroate synthase [Chitinophaga nivalis]|uniref:dihydropteroate synthase n=1 Tax=Chitinophaga nivalis TaxID=2991709 RepID=A0ABT3ILA9_9BACT|nr:dihydropteroate synthase [Chitinophaga nivalis]MCW3465608.1 dihydropteroate synthase [Chitinophaga nivalis]MCW3484701.1 dihydropteroate synthase [Chitinophaga nivalis]